MNEPRFSNLRDAAQAAYNRHGVAGRGMERIAEKHGHVISRSTFDRILAGTYTSRPTAATLEALAFLADVPPAEVYAAAGRRKASTPFAEQLPPDVDYLTDDQRASLITVMRAFINANRELEALRSQEEVTGNADSPASITQGVAAAPTQADYGKAAKEAHPYIAFDVIEDDG